MAMISKHVSEDWCHICGGRSADNVDIWFPPNAEHQSQDRPHVGACVGNGFIRICAACGEDIRRVGAGGVETVIADRPGWYKKTSVMKGTPR